VLPIGRTLPNGVRDGLEPAGRAMIRCAILRFTEPTAPKGAVSDLKETNNGCGRRHCWFGTDGHVEHAGEPLFFALQGDRVALRRPWITAINWI